MDRYQEALHFLSINGVCNDTECKECSIKKICHRYSAISIIQEAVDTAIRYDELQKVYFKNEPMESADLNGVKLQELYDFCSKLIDKANKYDEKETAKKPTFLNYGGYKIGNWHCPVCDKIIHRNEDYCITCGQHLDWSDE